MGVFKFGMVSLHHRPGETDRKHSLMNNSIIANVHKRKATNNIQRNSHKVIS